MDKEIHQHYQTCHDLQCSLFDAESPLKGCSALKSSSCRYQTVHILNGTEDDQKLNGQYHGIQREWYWSEMLSEDVKTDRLLEELVYVNGKMEGMQRTWHRNGQLESEKVFKDGNYHGLHRDWHVNGQLKSECNYENGLYHGLYRAWRAGGELCEEGSYVNGKEEGLHVWWSNGQARIEHNYKDGELIEDD